MCFFTSLNTGKPDKNVNSTRSAKPFLLELAGVWMRITVPRRLAEVEAGTGGSIPGCPGRGPTAGCGYGHSSSLLCHNKDFKVCGPDFQLLMRGPCRFLPANLETSLKLPNPECWCQQLDSLWENGPQAPEANSSL